MLENMTRQNLAMFERAMQMFSPFAPRRTGEEEPRANGTADSKATEDISDLKNEIEAMRQQLAELSQQRK